MGELKIIKKELVETCIGNLEETAGNAKREMNDIQQQANEYGPPKDRYDSFRAQLLRKRDLFAEQYQKALEEIDILLKIDVDLPMEEVRFGSIVITDTQRIFVATGIGKVKYNEMDFFVISPNVPVFKAMEGLRQGDEYQVNGKKFLIKQLL